MKNSKKVKLLFLIIMSAICLAGVLFSAYKIYIWRINDIESDIIQDELSEFVEVTNNTNETSELNIDFDSLKKQNKDTVGYIKVNNTRVEYVVVQGKDNSYYLSHNFKKKSSKAGWIFADYHNKIDGTDRNLVIFGHNKKNGSMFGTLKNTLEKEWYKNEENHIITFAKEDGIHHYQIFSIYSVPNEDYYINTSFKNDDEFGKFLKTIKSRSIYKFDTKVEKTDKILTLSTCNNFGRYRIAVHAKYID